MNEMFLMLWFGNINFWNVEFSLFHFDKKKKTKLLKNCAHYEILKLNTEKKIENMPIIANDTPPQTSESDQV